MRQKPMYRGLLMSADRAPGRRPATRKNCGRSCRKVSRGAWSGPCRKRGLESRSPPPSNFFRASPTGPPTGLRQHRDLSRGERKKRPAAAGQADGVKRVIIGYLFRASWPDHRRNPRTRFTPSIEPHAERPAPPANPEHLEQGAHLVVLHQPVTLALEFLRPRPGCGAGAPRCGVSIPIWRSHSP